MRHSLMAVIVLANCAVTLAIGPPEYYRRARSEARYHVQLAVDRVVLNGAMDASGTVGWCRVTGTVKKVFRGDDSIHEGTPASFDVECRLVDAAPPVDGLFVLMEALHGARFVEAYLDREPLTQSRFRVRGSQAGIIPKISARPACPTDQEGFWCGDPREEHRLAAAYYSGVKGFDPARGVWSDPPGLLILRKQLAAADAPVREIAARTLGKTTSNESLAIMVERVGRESDPWVLGRIVYSLAQYDDPRSIRAVLDVVRGNESSLQTCAFQVLQRRHMTLPVDALSALLRCEEATVRLDAARSLAEAKDSRAIAVLEELEHHPDPYICEPAASALKRARGVPELEILLAALRGRDYMEREGAIRTLIDRRDPASIPPLIEIVGSGTADARRAASEVLKGIAGIDLGDNPDSWKEWWRTHRDEFSKPVPSPLPPP